jgi:hypothetical protein
MSKSPRYSPSQIRALADEVREEGYCVLRGHFAEGALAEWRQAFTPLLERHVARQGHPKKRDANRYYVTLPFRAPFADPGIYEDDDILAIVSALVGEDAVLSQLACDTALLGSDYQEVRRDAPPLFPELDEETPAFQLAVDFPLVDVTRENGPVEIAKGTHCIPKAQAMRRLENGEFSLEPVVMKLGDVIVRDVRGLHRAAPNWTAAPRPMCMLGYNRRWLNRPDVSIRIPRAALDTLSARARQLLRWNPIVEDTTGPDETEVYQAFAY